MNRKWMLTSLALAIVVAVPGLVEAGWEEGVAAFKKGDYATAVSEFKPITDAKPDWKGGHYMLGWAYIKTGQNREAITHLRKAYDLDQKDPAVQMRLGQAYVAAGRYGDAIGFLSKINASSLPADQQAFLSELKAVALSKSGQSGQALAEFKKVAAAKPNDAQAQYQYGTAAYNDGSTDEAVNALAKAASLKSSDADIQSAYAKALSRKGRETRGASKTGYYQKATQAAQVVVSANGSYDNIMLLAEAQLGAKDYDGAIQNLTRAASANSGEWLPQYYTGQAYTAKQQYKSAESSLKQALDKAGSTADKQRIWKQLAFVYEKQKKFDDAILAYNQAGDSAGAQRAQENRDTQRYNQDVEAQNAELQRIQDEQERIKQELKDMPGGPPPGL
jgi:tetratricopeptide (TPR) repeat protein